MPNLPHSPLRNADRGAGIVDTEQEDPPVRILQRDHFRREVLRSRRSDDPTAETDLLELGSTVLAGADPAIYLLATLRHSPG